MLKPRKQLLEVRGVILRLALRERTPEHPHDRSAFEQGQVDRQFGNAAAGEAHDQQASVPGDGADGLVEEIAADRVVDHVCAVAVGEAFDFILEVGVGVVDEFVGTCVFGDFKFLCRACSGDDACTQRLADFHRSQADAAGCAEHQQGFAGLKVGALFEGVHRGAIGHAEGGGYGEVHAFGNGQHVVVRHGDLLCEAAPAGEGHDAVAGFEVGDFFPDRRDHACRLAAWRKGEGRFELVFAFDDEGVWKVDPGGVDVEQDFVLLDVRRRDIFEHQRAGGAEGFAQEGFHRGYSFSRDGR